MTENLKKNITLCVPIRIMESVLEELCKNGTIDQVDDFLRVHQKSVYMAFYFACIHHKLALAQWIYYSISNEDLMLFEKGSMFFYLACTSGDLPLAKWFYHLENPKSSHSFMIDTKCIDSYYFEKICGSGNLDFMEWSLTHLSAPMEECFIPAFHLVCLQGNLPMAVKMFTHYPSIQVDMSLFFNSCKQDHREMAHWLYMNFAFPSLKVSECYELFEKQKMSVFSWWMSFHDKPEYLEALFMMICEKENILLAGQFVEWFPQFDLIENHKYFRLMVEKNNGIMAKWFEHQFPERYEVTLIPITVHGFLTSRVLSYGIGRHCIKLKSVEGKVNISEKELCCVCYEEATLRTNCQHYYCKSCLSKWYVTHTNCPYCRATISNYMDVEVCSLN